jgi:hypothetical protein
VPGSRCGSLAEQRSGSGLLDAIKDFCFLANDTVRERSEKRLLRNCGETIMFLNARAHWPGGKFLRKGDEIFPRIWCPAAT